MEAYGCDERILKKMIELYVSYRGRYILCLPGGHIITPKRKNGSYSWLSDNILRNHLEHKYAIGVFADTYGSKFICFDVDDGNEETVHAVISELVRLGFSEDAIYVSYSGSKGYHIEMFFDGSILTKRLQDLYNHVIRACDLDPQKVEFRPTAKASIKLPLSRHAKTGHICRFVDHKTMKPIIQSEYILTIQQLRAEDVKALIPEASMDTAKQVNRENRSEHGKSSPETRNLGTSLEQEGTRHNMMRNIAVYQRSHGTGREACEKILEEWIEAQDPALYRSSQYEIQRDIDELIAWAYSDQFVSQRSASCDSTILRTSMLKVVLKQRSRTARRLCFLLLARCRMQQPRISEKDAGRAIGVSLPSVCKAMHRLIDAGDVQVIEDKRLKLYDGAFSAESRSYNVPHQEGYRNELSIAITMRELVFDFNTCYHRVLHSQVSQEVLRQQLSDTEWQEYMDYQSFARGEVSNMERCRRIDLVGTIRIIRHAEYGEMYVFDLDDRLLYPAYDVGLRLHLKNPSPMGCACPNRESWWIKVQRCVLRDGTPSYQVLRKNFVPAEDVRRLTRASKDERAEKICEWILSLEPKKEENIIEK